MAEDTEELAGRSSWKGEIRTCSIGISLGDARTQIPTTFSGRPNGHVPGQGELTTVDVKRAFTRLEVENDLRRAIEQQEVRYPLPAHRRSADRRAVGYGSPGEVGPP